MGLKPNHLELADVFIRQLRLTAHEFAVAQIMPRVRVDLEYDIYHDAMRMMARATFMGIQKQHAVPTTWWDHLKRTVVQRWPRLKRWLPYQTTVINVRALFPEIEPFRAQRQPQHIMYMAEPAPLVYSED